MTLKKILYWSSYLIPGRPTLALRGEYKKPKEKRDKIIMVVGYIGTAFLCAKLIGIATGIVTLDKIRNKKQNSLELKINSEGNFPVGNTCFYNESKGL